MVRVSPAKIRELGFEWPHSPIIEESAFVIAGEVHLTATLGNLEQHRDSIQSQVRAAQKLKADTGADNSDFSGRYDELASKLSDLEAACNYVKSIVAALSQEHRRASSPSDGANARPWGMWSILITASAPGLLGLAVVLGGLGIGLLVLGIGDNMPVITAPGMALLGIAVAFVIVAFVRGARKAALRSRDLAHDAVATPYRRRITIRVGIAFGILLVFVFYNWICWYGIHQDCTRAGDTGDRTEALALIAEATEAMDNPFLILPSDLFDLHGPNRCRSARRDLER